MDCNNFFVSCERLFRPDLAKKPVAVLSSNDGCIVARSQEVKDLGVPMGIPYFQVKELCRTEGITLFSSNFTLYRDISARVMTELRAIAESVEVYSVDEAFFRVPDSATEGQLRAMRERLVQAVGIPVSIGVAPTKTLAKHAAGIAKKERDGPGVHILDMQAWPTDAKDVQASGIWGIGRQTSQALRAHGIETVAELLAADRAFIRTLLGVGGVRIREELSGTPVLAGNERDVQGSIVSSRSFRKAVTDLATLESAIGYHVSAIAEELRREGWRATRLSVSIRPSLHGPRAGFGRSRDVLLAEPTAGTHALLAEALGAVRAIFVPGTPYKKAGVAVGGIMPDASVTQPLFVEDTAARRAGALDGVIDALNARFGRGTVASAVVMGTERWAASAERRSPAYTTDWDALATAKAA